ncbi:EamA/RhaT family transporter [Pseudomonas gingeri NCPPB 3146 = LMG 5327]|uniref:DMT family transporter n=2 Tax=Pseudomonas gingeri TaxID=117681 RepID=A0A7Y7Y6C7_9PSED|nr:DMT family transporter [Pseudomonas gingeri]NVZ61669.1 DMT family transporter [Pseudomonas gingeri]NVZ74802.1 DMT family transporter [Pseudomonas gingeri]NWC18677.1 DMT family transporter [Pseudomonas gingeri]PNQ90306.1 EamA/RhaT family transporter [Pseudomonas gingeri NCPPB 3146 = LMG 5327]
MSASPTQSLSTALPRPLAVLILATLACAFAGNHIAARIAFDHDTGLLLAILCRSGVTLLVLAGLVFWQRETLKLKAGTWRWQLLMGVLIAAQSFCVYSAVARIPVALALLVGNTAPILLVLLNWALGGRAPTRQAMLLMGMILIGLVFALDVPQRLSSQDSGEAQWLEGILFGFAAASVFACALWITEHKLSQVRGSVRSLLTLLVVFCVTALLGLSELLPGGISLPGAPTGWLALGCLVLLYGLAFSLLFICVSRLDIVRNAPVMNVEPIASLLFGWLILDQLLSRGQVIGGLIVVGGIVLLTSRKPA